MTSVNSVLDQATRRMLSRVVDSMEDFQVDPAKIARIQAASETATFPVNWRSFLMDIQDSMFRTAHRRYLRWRNNTGEKAEGMKRKVDESPSEGANSTQPPALSLHDTLHAAQGSRPKTANKESSGKKHRSRKRK